MWLLLIALVVCLVLLFQAKWRQQLSIHRWTKRLNIPAHSQVFHTLYDKVDGFALSRQNRVGQDAMEYVYGEIQFLPFIALLSLCHPNKDTVFYDLGSGTGKAVLACAMVFNVRKSCGIELFTGLHQCAEAQKTALLNLPAYQERAACIEFRQGNFLASDFKDGNIVFINATAFFGKTWTFIQQILLTMPKGTQIISTSKPLQAEDFRLIKKTRVAMSWGVVDAFIQERK